MKYTRLVLVTILVSCMHIALQQAYSSAWSPQAVMVLAVHLHQQQEKLQQVTSCQPPHLYPHPQANIYAADRSFFSFKQVVREMKSSCPLVSLHSTSKGFVGECGRRGGYMEVVNFPADVHEQILKLASINLCPNVSGQICCTLMMTPPEEGQPSYQLYVQVRTKSALM